MTMTQEKLYERLELHRKWLDGNDDGKKFEAVGEDLSGADFSGADLSEADLSRADLRVADLSGADLHGVKLDTSCLPLWCGSLYMHVDDRLAVQLLYHVVSTVLYSKHTSEELKRFCKGEEMLSWANRL